MFNGVSTNGVSIPQIQVGTSSGIIATGYVSDVAAITSAIGSASATSGHILINTGHSGFSYIGSVVFVKTGTSNTWVGNGTTAFRGSAGAISMHTSIINLATTLDRLRLTTVNGTDTFDAGTINISFEG
jgi:hypothetical protein